MDHSAANLRKVADFVEMSFFFIFNGGKNSCRCKLEEFSQYVIPQGWSKSVWVMRDITVQFIMQSMPLENIFIFIAFKTIDER